jgi:predicted CopG family antitoxin
MQKELTINVDEEIYEELNRIVGPEHISQFIESLIRPQLIGVDLESAYRQMAEDEARESEALEWAEATIGDVGDEAR